MLSSIRGFGWRQSHNHFWIIVTSALLATLWSISIVEVYAAPANFDFNLPHSQQQQQQQFLSTQKTLLPLELQPPIYEPQLNDEYNQYNNNNNNNKLNTLQSSSTAIDSYGNPIDTLRPVETPDGRKVVSAQGLQFEIPNYASGITELKKPAADLLPPFVGEFLTSENTTTTTTPTTTSTPTITSTTTSLKTIINNNNNDNNNLSNINAPPPNHSTGNYAASALNSYAANNGQNVEVNAATSTSTVSTESTAENSALAHAEVTSLVNGLKVSTTNPLNAINTNPQTNSHNAHTFESFGTPITTLTHNNLLKRSEFIRPLSSQGLPFLIPYYADGITSIDSHNTATHTGRQQPSLTVTKSLETSILHLPPMPLFSNIAPLSNGNFNFPNVPSDLETLNRIAAKYHNPNSIPNLDPIVVALPNDDNSDDTTSNSGSQSTVDVESTSLLQFNSNQGTAGIGKNPKSKYNLLPAYILALNDPDIDGPVDYVPNNNGEVLKVIAWDLLPPQVAISSPDTSLYIVNGNVNNIDRTKDSKSTRRPTGQYDNGKYRKPTATTKIPTTVSTTTTTTTTTKRPTTTTTRYTTTTTTRRPTTTTTRRPTTTTTRRPTTTTTKRPAYTTTTTTESSEVIARYDGEQLTATPAPYNAANDDGDYYTLEGGNSYTLPSWLADFNDTELDVAVPFEVPADNNEYNHTVENDLLPPLEPFTDLNILNVTPSQDETTTTTAIPITTTTRRPVSTTRWSTTTTSYKSTTSWYNARPTVATTKSTYFNQKHDQTASSHTQSTSIFTTPKSTFAFNTLSTPKPTTTTTTTTTTTRQTTKQPISQNTHNPYKSPITVDTPNSQEVQIDTQALPQKSENPFLAARKSGKYQPQAFANRPATTTTARTTTTTTTTTTTPTPALVADEVFDETNPFDSSTIPSWLSDFDYPDVGPGVPFIWNETDVTPGAPSDLQPPTNLESQEQTQINDATQQSSITSAFNSIKTDAASSPSPNSFSPSISLPTLTASVNLPSKIPLPIPSLTDNTDLVTQPPLLFIPPTPIVTGGEVVNTAAAAALDTDETNFAPSDLPSTPLSADKEVFPPNNVGNDNNQQSLDESAIGKQSSVVPSLPIPPAVQTNPFLAIQRKLPAAAQTPELQQGIATNFPILSTPTSFTPIPTEADNLITSPSINTNTNLQLPGDFGAPNGQFNSNEFRSASPTGPIQPQQPQTKWPTKWPDFGGPPGVLVPFDNVKTG